MIPTFRSRFGLWTIRVALLVPAFLGLGFLVFDWGACTIGLNSPGGCAHIPRGIGDLALLGALAAYLFGVYVSPVLIAVGLGLEGLARFRARRKED